MTKGSIGLNAGAIWNLLSDGQHWSFEALRAKSALTDADLWSAIAVSYTHLTLPTILLV